MNLQNNPFYILDVSCSDKRRTIMSAAEELSFALDQNLCMEAQNVLINPGKRLAAEIDWFIDLDSLDLSRIRENIESRNPVSTDDLVSLSRLNATIYNLSLIEDADIYEVGYEIMDIDDLFSALDASEIMDQINEKRQNANMTEVTLQGIIQELGKKRENIRQMLNEILVRFTEEEYVELITRLAEKCIEAADRNHEIIFDLIDQYEIRMQTKLEKETRDVEQEIQRIKELKSERGVYENVKSFINCVKEWDKIAQPLQLKSQASGLPHTISEHLGLEIRELALFLNNERELAKEALLIVDAMKDVFAELEGLAELFVSDSNTLDTIVKEKDGAQEINREFGELLRTSEKIVLDPTLSSIEDYLARIVSLSRTIKQLDIEASIKNQLRDRICKLARDTAYEIHQKKKRTEFSYKIICELQAEFSDLWMLSAKLKGDRDVFESILERKAPDRKVEHTVSRETTSPDGVTQIFGTKTKHHDSGPGLWVVGLIFGVLILAIVFWSVFGGSKKSSSGSTKTSTSGAKVTESAAVPETSKASETTKATTEAATEAFHAPLAIPSTEKEFSSASEGGDKVYADIVSAFPEIGIYEEYGSYYTDFVCRCKTAAGSTVWVYIKTDDYLTYFDSSASTSVSSSYAEEVTFSSAIRIHGSVKTADNITKNLSESTGKYVIRFSSM